MRSELEKTFAQKQAAFDFFKTKKEWKVPDRSKAEFTDLYPEDQLEAAKDCPPKKLLESSGQRKAGQKLDTKSYITMSKFNHELNIDLEKYRRMVSKQRQVEGKHGLSEMRISSAKRSVETPSFNTEKGKRILVPHSNRQFALTFQGSKLGPERRDTSSIENMQSTFQPNRRVKTASSVCSLRQECLIDESHYESPIVDSHNLLSAGYVTDGFKKPSKLKPRIVSGYKRASMGAIQADTHANSFRLNNLVLRPSGPDDSSKDFSRIRFRKTSESLRNRSTSRGSVENNQHLYSIGHISLEECQNQKNTNLISQQIYAFCQNKSKKRARSNLLNGLLAKSSKFPLR